MIVFLFFKKNWTNLQNKSSEIATLSSLEYYKSIECFIKIQN